MIGSNAGGAFAHLGGALLGYLYIKQLRAGKDLGAWFNLIINFFTKSNTPNLKVVHKQQRTRKSNKEHITYQYDEQKVNAILDKISNAGYSSLSDAEKAYLMKASKDK